MKLEVMEKKVMIAYIWLSYMPVLLINFAAG